MTEAVESDELKSLREKTRELEGKLSAAEASAQAKLVRAELKTHAVRAGMVDLDGLKLIETDGLALNAKGEVEGAAELMSELRKSKPWLFGGGSSSSGAMPPPSAPLARKKVSDMSVEEWRLARAEILRRR
jgi:hypothetical protein